jgi:DNA repair exonuclease SbcCD ATPase subunit
MSFTGYHARNEEADEGDSASVDMYLRQVRVYEEEFCTHDNVEEYLAVVNSKLMVYGDPHGLPVEGLLQDERMKPLLSKVVNSVYGLLRKYELEKALHQQKAEQVERCSVEIDELQEKLERVQSQLEEAQSEVAYTHRCTESLRKEIALARQDAKTQKDQMQKTISSLTSRETQFKHEAVRKEKQIEALKEKLKAVQITKNRPERQSMVLLSSLWSTESHCPPPPPPPHEAAANPSIAPESGAKKTSNSKSQTENTSSNQKALPFQTPRKTVVV